MSCSFCGVDLYVKTIKYSKSLLAPITKADELRQRLGDLTGEVYLKVGSYNYCPMCGEKIEERGNENGKC